MPRVTRILAEDFYYGEGPRWHEGRLWFSDFYARAVKSVSLAGDLRVEFEIDDQPSGLGWMPDGSLLVVSMTKRQLLRRKPDGTISVHADLGRIATFHCNDMVVDSAGGAYVGNFGFNMDEEIAIRGAPDVIARHVTANIAYVSPDGQMQVAADGMDFPNGSIITPDGRTLIVSESLGSRLSAFDIGPHGVLSKRRVWAPTPGRIPDGVCLDAEGAVWFAAGIAPECVRIAEGGEVLEIVETGLPCFACMLGGPDGKTLFMLTAESADQEIAARARTGKLVIAEVDSGRAGLP
ncbi:SMP-30/gluconolactonase/LRE family protein [Rhizorhabdus dicambivorans]|uniref:Gluconolactonase n=1 Tax=Rhizorhabdus dicambivorans TaxID=1850238 RepID=A0A2A4FUD9_9SPHN|nr:SMP-30/gluconolactonase/LRE family protein [Rhizorhabdus dicambivorans]ATE64718.1 gluconolactonase [Rhizorhabdus dicambivorans]PCE41340.1 gluconolactonase [Rhizorhabdus dicambivorans]